MDSKQFKEAATSAIDESQWVPAFVQLYILTENSCQLLRYYRRPQSRLECRARVPQEAPSQWPTTRRRIVGGHTEGYRDQDNAWTYPLVSSHAYCCCPG